VSLCLHVKVVWNVDGNHGLLCLFWFSACRMRGPRGKVSE
jgi:hypothetical protein